MFATDVTTGHCSCQSSESFLIDYAVAWAAAQSLLPSKRLYTSTGAFWCRLCCTFPDPYCSLLVRVTSISDVSSHIMPLYALQGHGRSLALPTPSTCMIGSPKIFSLAKA
jgi:hypothetical protein